MSRCLSTPYERAPRRRPSHLASAARAELILVLYPPKMLKASRPWFESTLDFQP